ncbi:MAG: PIN domain-containing protein [Candidatus Saccharimonadales bacterium]
MAIIVVDSSAISAYGRASDSRLAAWFSPKHQLLIPLIVVAELRAGFAAGNKRQANEGLLRRFLDAPNVDTLTINDKTTSIYAEIYLKLRKAGRPIGTNDMWIAAIAMEHNKKLLTLDRDFVHIPGLQVVKL